MRQLEADATQADHPERAKILWRVEQARRQWEEERVAERQARAKARKKKPAANVQVAKRTTRATAVSKHAKKRGRVDPDAS